MVLLDNNFASVVNAVRWGRSVNDNIKKFLQFQLTINIGGVLLTVIGSLASETNKEPFTPVQLLWLNLIMDTLAALALATERPGDEILRDLPVFKQAALITNRMKVFIVLHALLQVSIIFMHMFSSHIWLDTVEGNCSGPFTRPADNALIDACAKYCKDEGGLYIEDGGYCQQGTTHSTIIFNTYIWLQVFNIFNARILTVVVWPFHQLFTNSYMLCIVVVVIAGFQIFAIEAAGSFMQTTGLDYKNWLICVAFGATEIVFGFFVRVIPMKNDIPIEVLEKWEHERKMKESLGLVPKDSHTATTPRTEESRLFVRSDPALHRRHVAKS
jgi:magnesium-transporting ATPase (P-type)